VDEKGAAQLCSWINKHRVITISQITATELPMSTAAELSRNTAAAEEGIEDSTFPKKQVTVTFRNWSALT